MIDLSLSNMSTNICWSQPWKRQHQVNRLVDVYDSRCLHIIGRILLSEPMTWISDLKMTDWTAYCLAHAPDQSPETVRSSGRWPGWRPQRWRFSSPEASYPAARTHLERTRTWKSQHELPEAFSQNSSLSFPPANPKRGSGIVFWDPPSMPWAAQV